jgi:SNF2 family DNA or RNA helicase
MEILTRLVVNERDSLQRILIFAEHDSALTNIQSILGGQPYAMLSGHSTTRTRTLASYKSGQTPILLLNSRMNGAGLDLPETTDVVLFHSMHQSIEEQAIGRGHRMGRTTSLRVHRFLAVG